MPTKAIGKDTKNLAINVSTEFHAEIAKAAKAQKCKSVGEFVRGVLAHALSSGKTIKEVSSTVTTVEKTTHWIVVKDEPILQAAEDGSDYPNMLPPPVLVDKKPKKYPKRKA